jgi:PKD repeat protein
VGAAYHYDGDDKAQADGSQPISWTATSAPDGFSIDASTGAVSWTPAAAGSFSPCLHATNAYGHDDQCFTVSVTTQAHRAPTAKVRVADQQGLTASFDGTGSTDPDGHLTTYAWEFGDGQSGTGSLIDHTYAAAGTYAVHLTVTDDAGLTASDVTVVNVGAPAGGKGCAAAGADFAALFGLLALALRRRSLRA